MSKLNFRYCIFCEKDVAVEEPVEGHSVVEFVPDMGESEVMWCEGPFVESAPPELGPDWEMTMEEPSSTEVFMMNLLAEQLKKDFGD